MEKWIIAAITGVFATFSNIPSFAAESCSATEQPTEKCYGIAKAGKNDCATAKQSCSNSSTKDAQPEDYIFLPQGTCEKIVGGSLAPGNPVQDQKKS